MFVLDLYFGPSLTDKQKKELSEAKLEYLRAKRDFQKFVWDLDHKPEGGKRIVDQIKSQFVQKPGYVFFTRKGTLEDAVNVMPPDGDALAVIKKPDPDELPDTAQELEAANGAALERHIDSIAAEIDYALTRASLRYRWQERIVAFTLGVVASLIAGVIIWLFQLQAS